MLTASTLSCAGPSAALFLRPWGKEQKHNNKRKRRTRFPPVAQGSIPSFQTRASAPLQVSRVSSGREGLRAGPARGGTLPVSPLCMAPGLAARPPVTGRAQESGAWTGPPSLSPRRCDRLGPARGCWSQGHSCLPVWGPGPVPEWAVDTHPRPVSGRSPGGPRVARGPVCFPRKAPEAGSLSSGRPWRWHVGTECPSWREAPKRPRDAPQSTPQTPAPRNRGPGLFPGCGQIPLLPTAPAPGLLGVLLPPVSRGSLEFHPRSARPVRRSRLAVSRGPRATGGSGAPPQPGSLQEAVLLGPLVCDFFVQTRLGPRFSCLPPAKGAGPGGRSGRCEPRARAPLQSEGPRPRGWAARSGHAGLCVENAGSLIGSVQQRGVSARAPPPPVSVPLCAVGAEPTAPAGSEAADTQRPSGPGVPREPADGEVEGTVLRAWCFRFLGCVGHPRQDAATGLGPGHSAWFQRVQPWRRLHAAGTDRRLINRFPSGGRLFLLSVL